MELWKRARKKAVAEYDEEVAAAQVRREAN